MIDKNGKSEKDSSPECAVPMTVQQKPVWGGYKYLACLILCLQNATLVLVMRHTRTRSGDMYISTTVVVMTELVKTLVCLFLVYKDEGYDLKKWLNHLHANIIQDPMDTLKLAVPSGIYTLQNNLLYVAVSNLDAATFQVSYQLKILTTAIFSVTMLGKSLSKQHWGSLLILFMGVSAVQIQNATKKASVSEGEQSQLVGMAAVLISCISSGFAGVYFEKILKGSKGSLWLRNIQLGGFGMVFGLLGMAFNDGAAVSQKGFFFGYDYLVWFIVVFQAFGGLLVAVVVKYADNIMKGFATSAAIILSCVASVYFFDYVITLQFTFGTILVILSVYLYGKADVAPKPKLPP